MWEWYVIVGRPVRFERLVNSRLSSDDDSQEFVIFDSFGVGPDLLQRAQWLRLQAIRHRRAWRQDMIAGGVLHSPYPDESDITVEALRNLSMLCWMNGVSFSMIFSVNW